MRRQEASAGKSWAWALPGKTDRLSRPGTAQHMPGSSCGAAAVEMRATDLERRPLMDDIASETGFARTGPAIPSALLPATRRQWWRPARRSLVGCLFAIIAA